MIKIDHDTRQYYGQYRAAFLTIRARVYELQKIPIGGCTQAERAEETSLIFALHAMRSWSGSFHLEGMIQDEVPSPREES